MYGHNVHNRNIYVKMIGIYIVSKTGKTSYDLATKNYFKTIKVM